MAALIGERELVARVEACLRAWALGAHAGEEIAAWDSGPPAESPTAPLALSLALEAALDESFDPARPDPAALARTWSAVLGASEGAYGYALRNLGQGLLPPFSGSFRNPCLESGSALERAVVWACLAPGSPGYAALLAHVDSSVDQNEEGALAAMLIAGFASAAVVERDISRALAHAAGLLPPGCELGECAHALRRARRKGQPWVEAFAAIDESLGHLPHNHAQQTAARVALTALYATTELSSLRLASDAGGRVASVRAVTAAIAALAGHVLPEAWSPWLGDSPPAHAEVAGSGARSYTTAAEALVARARSLAEFLGPHVRIEPGETDLTDLDPATVADPSWAHLAFERRSDEVRTGEGDLALAVRCEGGPSIAPGGSRTLLLSAPGLDAPESRATLLLRSPAGLTIGPDKPQPAGPGAYVLASARGKEIAARSPVEALLQHEDGREASLTVPLIAENCWWVCGPFDAGGAEPMRAARGPERNLSATATYEGRDRMRLRFRKVSRPGFVLGFEEWLQGLPGIVYAIADLRAEEPFEGQMLLAATGPVRAWLGGKSLLRRDECQERLDLTACEPLPLKLAAGATRLVVKLNGASADAALALEFVDRQGRPSVEPTQHAWLPLSED